MKLSSLDTAIRLTWVILAIYVVLFTLSHETRLTKHERRLQAVEKLVLP